MAPTPDGQLMRSVPVRAPARWAVWSYTRNAGRHEVRRSPGPLGGRAGEPSSEGVSSAVTACARLGSFVDTHCVVFVVGVAGLFDGEFDEGIVPPTEACFSFS